MYDVYLNGRNDLLVVPQGYFVPSDLGGNWRKKKRAVRSGRVSAAMRSGTMDGIFRETRSLPA
jgi:hypothetical protein